MNFFTSWLKARKQRSDAKEANRGYCWAAGELLRGLSVEYVGSSGYGLEPTAFDVGINSAIRDWEDKLKYHEEEEKAVMYNERERCANLCRRPAGWLTPDQERIANEIRESILKGYG